MRTIILISIFLFSTLFIKAQGSIDTTKNNYQIYQIEVTGNKKTKEQIIIRELPMQIGDSISGKEIASFCKKAEENIMNLSLFNFVTVTVSKEKTQLIIHIDVSERWYLWPMPFLVISDRNFNSWLEKKDFKRLTYGLFLLKDNCRGRNEKLQILAAYGYNEQIGFSYSIPYINKEKTWGMKFLSLYQRTHESPYATIDNKEKFLRLENSYAKTNFEGLLEFNYRKNIHNYHRFRIEYNQISVDDSLLLLNPNYLHSPSTEYLLLNYKFKHDYRNYIHYPLTGHYFDFEVSKYGLQIFDKKINHTKASITARKFMRISEKTYFATELRGGIKFSKNNDYVFSQALGYYNDYVRSYEHYVTDGQVFVLAKTNLKYELLPKREKVFSFIPWKKFNHLHYALYLNFFTDAAYVYQKNPDISNTLSNKILFGSGVGLDFVTYYDMVFRLEYSWNPIYQGGFFIHFTAPI